MELLPKVFRTEGDIVEFDSSKIFNSLIIETSMSEDDAKHITELVVRRIISSGFKFLSGPHIREVVCSILSENNFEQERKIYTRIGMPVMDYENILENGPEIKKKTLFNPEKIHHLAANQLAEEYSLLRLLTDNESRAHLYGDIYIHHLKYFDLRLDSQVWDPRIILKYGLPPLKNWNLTSKSAPPKNLIDAASQLARWLGIIQSEFSGEQKLEHITIFLAPYISNLSDKEIENILKIFIYEVNQLSMITAKNIIKTSISCSPTILEDFLYLSAIQPNGIISGVYGDYKKECLKIFEILTQIYMNGDYNHNPFTYPNQYIFLNELLLEKFKHSYLKVITGAIKSFNPYFINLYPTRAKKTYINDAFTNYGILQKVSLNLPRFAYISENEDNFIEVLIEQMNLSIDILKKKLEIIKKRLKSNRLPFCSNLEKETLFSLDNQDLCLGFVGLNEALKYLTNTDFHENSESLKLGKRIIVEMNKLCHEKSKELQTSFSLIGHSSAKAVNRFARLDLKHFPKNITTQFRGEFLSYTDSFHFHADVEMNVLERIILQGEFHHLASNNVVEKISLGKNKQFLEDPQEIYKFLKQICTKSKISCIKFTA